MKNPKRKSRKRRRKCLHCQELYVPDSRNHWHQRNCTKPGCRQASKKASQARWLGSDKGRGYFRSTVHVRRVQEWRISHPGYLKRDKAVNADALQEVLISQPVAGQEDTHELRVPALQDVISSQPALLLGLVATLTGHALQDDVVESSRRFILMGQDILGIGPGNKPKGGCRDGCQTHSLSGTSSPGAETVQLG